MGYRSNRQSGCRSRNLAFMSNLINEGLVCARLDIHINANDWNTAYRSEIIDRQSGNRSRDSEVVMGSLIDDGD
jgi:hypothetical protein